MKVITALMALMLVFLLWLPIPARAATPAGCDPPPPPGTSKRSGPAFFAPPELYASGVVEAANVVSPENVLGVEDEQMAVMSETSVLTVTWPDTFNSRIGVRVYQPMESICEYGWLYTEHYIDLRQPPIYTAANAGAERGVWSWMGEYMAPFMPLHRYVVLRFNTLVYVDTVYYIDAPRKWWMPVVLSQD